MKRLSFTVAVVLTLASACLAADAALQWDYSAADQANIAGFRILYTDVNLGKDYTYTLADPAAREVKEITTTLQLIPSHQYSFTCRAYAGVGESADSNMVTWDVPPFVPPGNLSPVKIDVPAPGSILIFLP